MSLTTGLHHIHLARVEFVQELSECPAEDHIRRDKLTVLTEHTSHVLALGRRYVDELKKEAAKA